MMMMMMMKTG